MEKGRGNGTDTLPTDNIFTRKEYIEREAALEEIINADVMCNIPADAYRVLRRYIERIPAADVVSRDCYDRLLVENDELRKERPVVHGRWIPVTERLPEKETPVIVTDGVDVGEGMLFKSWWYSPADIDTEHITHWMPLPKPPKEET